MKCMNLIVAAVCCSLFCLDGSAQETAQRKKPFTLSGLGFTVTGIYSEGRLEHYTTGGGSVFFGLITWGGTSVTRCLPGPGVCKLEVITSISVNRVITDENGDNGFEPVKRSADETPVLVTANKNEITFAVDIRQVSENQRQRYDATIWNVENGFALGPEMVKRLGLYQGSEPMGYIIPAGQYPLYRDGNIAYWSFQPPR